jgi:hypothetical protein
MKNMLLAVLLGSTITVGLIGCFGDKDDTGPDTTEGDTDTDTDADSDTDADADSDSDADTDVGDCTMNSGWPCSCQTTTCDDGSDCIGVHGLGDGSTGYCAPNCTSGDHSSCPDTSYGASPTCALSDGTNYWCVLVCSGNGDCPADQTCQDAGGASVCYPG